MICAGLILLTAGCAGREEKKSNGSENIVSEINSQIKKSSSDFNKSNNQKEDLKGVSYEVPKVWNKQTIKDGFAYLSYNNESVLTVSYIAGEGSVMDAEFRNGIINGIYQSTKNYKLGFCVDDRINAHNAMRLEYSGEANGKIYDQNMRAFDIKGGSFVISIGVASDSNLDYEQDFENILESLDFDAQSEAINKTVKKEFTAGKYTVGKDIPEGIYDIKWVSGAGNCFVGNEVSEMFGSDTKYYIKEYKNAELKVTDKIEITSTLKVSFNPK